VVEQLSMSLIRMDDAKENVYLLDKTGLCLEMPNRTSPTEPAIDVELRIEPLVLRATSQDIALIVTIVNKALLLSNKADQPKGGQTARKDSSRRASQSNPQDSRLIPTDEKVPRRESSLN
jgi:hypothetical protein